MKRQHGYTLLQIAVVLLILGILVTLAVPQYRNYTLRAKASEVIAQYDEAREYIAIETNNQDVSCSQFQAIVDNHPISSRYVRLEIMHAHFDSTLPNNYHQPVLSISASPKEQGHDGVQIAKEILAVMQPTGRVGPYAIVSERLVAYFLVLGDGLVQDPCRIRRHTLPAGSHSDQTPQPVTTSSVTVQASTVPIPDVSARTQDLCKGLIGCTMKQTVGDNSYNPGAVCPEDKPWGMQTMSYDRDTKTSTFSRQCADTDTCSAQWWQSSSGNDLCRDPQDPMTAAKNAGYDLQCSYCCTGQNCLSSGQGLLPPDRSTWLTAAHGMQ